MKMIIKYLCVTFISAACIAFCLVE